MRQYDLPAGRYFKLPDGSWDWEIEKPPAKEA
jgi:hypothetical protein